MLEMMLGGWLFLEIVIFWKNVYLIIERGEEGERY